MNEGIREEVIRDEFLIELLDALDDINTKAIRNSEKELMYRIISTVNENIEFIG